MRVLLWGNQDNAGYRLCRWLREAGVEASLYLMKRDNIRSHPESIDRALSTGYPNWIKTYDNSGLGLARIPRTTRDEIARSYDIAIASGLFGMMTAWRLPLPTICYSTGPSNLGVVKMDVKDDLLHKGKMAAARFFCQHSVSHCDKILVHYDPELLSLINIGQQSKQILFGFPEDVEGNRGRIDQSLRADLMKRFGGYDRVFLWLSRINFVDRTSSEYKGTEHFVAALKRVAAHTRNIRVVFGQHGYDVAELEVLIKREGLESCVEYVPHLPYWQLLTFLSLPNAIVFDELTPNTAVSSGMMREALSVGAVVVKSFNPLLTAIGHGPCCPVLHASNADDVYDRMVEVLSWTKEELQKRQRSTLSWSMKYLHWKEQIGRLIMILEEVLYVRCLPARVRGSA